MQHAYLNYNILCKTNFPSLNTTVDEILPASNQLKAKSHSLQCGTSFSSERVHTRGICGSVTHVQNLGQRWLLLPAAVQGAE